MPVVTFIRGLPGSGKSTLATQLRNVDAIIEADNFLIDEDGEYRFTPERCGEAHISAIDALNEMLSTGSNNVVVSNTFSRKWEFDNYALVIPSRDVYTVVIIDLFDAGLTDEELAARCVHGVPVEKIAVMRARWERW